MFVLTFDGDIVYLSSMVSALVRLVAIITISLALCAQSGIVSAALIMGSAADTCCPSEPPGKAEEGDRCGETECQCVSCLSIVLQEITVSFAGFVEPDVAYYERTPALTGAVYRTIDYPPEVA